MNMGSLAKEYKLPRLANLQFTLTRRLLSGPIGEMYLALIRQIAGSWGERLRYRYYRRLGMRLGKGVRIDTGVFIEGAKYVHLGADTHIDKNCIIVASPPDLDLSKRAVKRRWLDEYTITPGEVRIGRNCHISQNCMIYGYGGVTIGDCCVMSAGAKIYSLTSMSQHPDDPARVVSIVPYEGISPTLIGPVVFADNVWIGLDVIVSPGVAIGGNSFVRSRSIVLHSFGPNSHIAGDPANRIKSRFAEKDKP